MNNHELAPDCLNLVEGVGVYCAIPELLDAHYHCRFPGPSACLQDALQDALHMITEPHSVQITRPGAKKKEEDERNEGDEHEPRILSELEVHVINEIAFMDLEKGCMLIPGLSITTSLRVGVGAPTKGG